jgi:hypothetical protein
MTRLITIVEMPEFIRRAKAILSDGEHEEIINTLAHTPEAGVAHYGEKS